MAPGRASDFRAGDKLNVASAAMKQQHGTSVWLKVITELSFKLSTLLHMKCSNQNLARGDHEAVLEALLQVRHATQTKGSEKSLGQGRIAFID
eukprot:1156350-Pelagomonas_calceolata.AAC.19